MDFLELNNKLTQNVFTVYLFMYTIDWLIFITVSGT